jgi:hypothetical protein
MSRMGVSALSNANYLDARPDCVVSWWYLAGTLLLLLVDDGSDGAGRPARVCKARAQRATRTASST